MFTLEHYVRYSHASECHFVHDFGTAEELGLQYDHYPIKLDRKKYRYNTYHYAFASLGESILNSLNVGARTFSPGVDNPRGLVIRTQPFGTDLYADTESDIVVEDMPALPEYDWDFDDNEF